MTVTAPTMPLSPGEQRAAGYLVRGLSPRDIAVATRMAPATVRTHIRRLRKKLDCPPGCPVPVLVHSLLVSGQVAPPKTDMPAPDLSTKEQQLLRALAEQSKPIDLVVAAGVPAAGFRHALQELLQKTGAANPTQLVALAHAWKLLGAHPSAAAPAGVSR
ncbi:helix-turn-helix transcriptional regulator [Streptomyces sp. NPDC051041]|uniref:helix-turn-helix transcriptional regulator n=1 Tax=Streptomyces sp. NPDC051041 TaxID=3365640 RepID=UPI0037BBD209